MFGGVPPVFTQRLCSFYVVVLLKIVTTEALDCSWTVNSVGRRLTVRRMRKASFFSDRFMGWHTRHVAQ